MKYCNAYYPPKRCYQNEDAAKKGRLHIWESTSMSLAEFEDLQPYLCEKCGKYHLGHQSYYEMSKSV